MNDVMEKLLKLQSIEFSDVKSKDSEAEAAQLRTQIPQPFLGHYDRLRARDKKGLAAVRNQVCTGCHMHQPIGKITIIMRGEDVQLCDSCGRYLYLPPEESQPAAAELVAGAAPAAKPAKAPRKRKAKEVAQV